MLEKIISFVIALLCISVIVPSEEMQQQENNAPVIHYSDALALVCEYPHDTTSFTQGLFFYGGEMYESTGQYEKSKLYKNIDIASGTAETEYSFSGDIFAEGSVVFGDTLYVLTYRENQVLTFDPETLEYKNTYSYPRQGWGLTTDGEYLIASDGTSDLFFMDESLGTQKTVTVRLDGKAQTNINELEYINGEIWANQWLTERILIIDPDNGNVKRVIDFSGMYTPISESQDDVLNGIAYNPESGKIYITGKHWNKLYEFELADITE